MNIADRDMGINRQVSVLLQALAVEEVRVEVPGSMWFRTMPYGNCRERGFVLSISRRAGKPINLAFFEHRNSDALCCVRWEGNTPVSDVVRYDDIDPAAYPNKWDVTVSWPYMGISQAVEYVHSVIAEAVDTDLLPPPGYIPHKQEPLSAEAQATIAEYLADK